MRLERRGVQRREKGRLERKGVKREEEKERRLERK